MRIQLNITSIAILYRSCQLFQDFSNSLAHIFRVKSNSDTINFLDDFFFAELLKKICNESVQCFLDICAQINFPVSLEKTEWATQEIVFLGLLINTIQCFIAIPLDKRDKALALLDQTIRTKSMKVVALQQLTGVLNFLAKAIVPGRAFTRRMYSKYAGLKQYHHLKVDGELRSDCLMWWQFLQNQTAVNRPFVDFKTKLDSHEIPFSTDASAAAHRGFGGVIFNHFFFEKWPVNFIRSAKPSIALLELYAVAVAIELFTPLLPNRRVTIKCDNQAVVNMINKSTSSCKRCMWLIRKITLTSMKFNTRYFCEYITSKNNFLPDLLSRLKLRLFRLKAHQEMDLHPTPLPSSLWPIPAPLWKPDKTAQDKDAKQ